jgi:nuclear pore complex protein Nup210
MTQDLVFKRGNLVVDDHSLPAIAEVALSLTCSFPSSIALIVDEPGEYLNFSSQT